MPIGFVRFVVLLLLLLRFLLPLYMCRAQHGDVVVVVAQVESGLLVRNSRDSLGNHDSSNDKHNEEGARDGNQFNVCSCILLFEAAVNSCTGVKTFSRWGTEDILIYDALRAPNVPFG